MALIADGLLIATALTAALYCFVLSRRLRRLTEAGSGIGGQIQALNKALEETRAALDETRRGLGEMRASAKNASERLSREVWLADQSLDRLGTATALADRSAARLEAATAAAAAPPTPEWPADEFEAYPADDGDEDTAGAVPVHQVLAETEDEDPFDTLAAEAAESDTGPLRVRRMAL